MPTVCYREVLEWNKGERERQRESERSIMPRLSESRSCIIKEHSGKRAQGSFCAEKGAQASMPKPHKTLHNVAQNYGRTGAQKRCAKMQWISMANGGWKSHHPLSLKILFNVFLHYSSILVVSFWKTIVKYMYNLFFTFAF